MIHILLHLMITIEIFYKWKLFAKWLDRMVLYFIQNMSMHVCLGMGINVDLLMNKVIETINCNLNQSSIMMLIY